MQSRLPPSCRHPPTRSFHRPPRDDAYSPSVYRSSHFARCQPSRAVTQMELLTHVRRRPWGGIMALTTQLVLFAACSDSKELTAPPVITPDPNPPAIQREMR